MTNFDKKYIPKDKESQIREFWESEEIYKFDKETSKPIFSIDTPPPTMSGKMHLGHAFSYSQQDFVARYKRMQGFEVFFPFGTDDNGLATEKLVQKAKKVDLRKVDRKEAVKIVLDYLNEERPHFIEDWQRIGMSCDFDLGYSTISNYSQKLSQTSFLELVKKGLVEKKKGPVMWDRVFQTAIAQAELEDKEQESNLNYVKAKVKGSENTYMIFATTRPELIFACAGFSVEDAGDYVKLKVGDEYWVTGKATFEEKFKNFDYEIVANIKGKDLIESTVIIPIVGREIQVTHDESIKADLGTGIAYFCSYGGIEDIEYFARHNLEPIEVIDIYGKLNEQCGEKFQGLLASKQGREAVIEELNDKCVLVMKEKITHIVNVGERSGAEVEFIVSSQWYVNYLEKKEYFFEMAQKFNWTPEHMKHRLENWINGLNWNWGVSRQRHFGIPIPVWYDKTGKMYFADESQLPVDPTVDRPLGVSDDIELTGETDVFDTWFTSASSPILATSLVEDKELQEKIFPMDLRPQSHDIINFWLFYTMAKTNLIYEKNPFKDVNVSGWVLAPDGTKMSKSKGNTIAPQDVVGKFSNDAVRFAASATKLGSDQPYQEKEVQTGIKVVNKIFNANKFASMLLENFKVEYKDFDVNELNSIDKWILARLQKTINSATQAFEKYDYAKAKSEFELFFMRDIADNYIEIVKQRLWKPDEVGQDETLKAQKALYKVLYASLRGLAPVLPFITEEIYQKFYSQFEEEKSIHQTSWPKFEENLASEEQIELGDKFVAVVGAVRKYKSEKQLSMKTQLEVLTIDCDEETQKFIENSIGDLMAVTGAQAVKFDKATIQTDLTGVKVDIIVAQEE